jgi:YHS domain-containing protein
VRMGTVKKLAVFLFAAAALGCGGKEEKGMPATGAGAGTPKKDPFAALSPADAAQAKAQGTCPISGEELGSMGTPYKVTVGGKSAFLCCEHCLEEFMKDPEKHFAEIAAKR